MNQQNEYQKSNKMENYFSQTLYFVTIGKDLQIYENFISFLLITQHYKKDSEILRNSQFYINIR